MWGFLGSCCITQYSQVALFSSELDIFLVLVKGLLVLRGMFFVFPLGSNIYSS